MFTKRRFVLAIILITSLVCNANAANVYGTIYEWSGLETPLKNTIVEVEENSTRMQYKVSVDGTYFFDISPGRYIIKAKYYNNNILEFYGEEELEINIPDETRNIDIILFPPTFSELEYLGDINLTEEIGTKDMDYTNYFISLLVVLLIISYFLFNVMKKKKKPGISEEVSSSLPEEHEEKKHIVNMELPDDLRELYDIIMKKGGRITQKDLRKEVIYGEAKVSLMVADLEDRGMIKKIKKGRSNIIIAENIR